MMDRCGLRWAGILLALLLPLPASASEAYPGRRWASSLVAFGEAEIVAIARVVERERGPQIARARLHVDEVLKGALPSGPTTVDARADRAPVECDYPASGTVLTLLARGPAGIACVAGFRISAVALAGDPNARGAVRELVAGYLEALPPAPPDAAAFQSFLVEQIGVANRVLRAGVLYDLGERIEADDLPLLTSLFGDPERDEEVRVWAVDQLRRLQPGEIPAQLAALYEPSSSPRLRQAVLQAYGARRDPSDLPLFRRGFRDPVPEVRRSAIESVGFPEAVAPLRSAFEAERVEEVRFAIVRQLGILGSREAVEALRGILEQETDVALREVAELELAAALERSGAP
jgi:hypothetical protein